MTDKTGGPAFPIADIYHGNGQIEYGATGMTLRDYFATHAPKEVLDVEGWTESECAFVLGIAEYRWQDHYKALLARLSYQYADAMLAERAK